MSRRQTRIERINADILRATPMERIHAAYIDGEIDTPELEAQVERKLQAEGYREFALCRALPAKRRRV